MSNNNLDLIDSQLSSLDLVRKEIPKDGACLFRCISEYIYGTQIRHRYVRSKCIEYLEANRERFEPFACINDPWERYIELMNKDDTWGGEIELQALSLYYKVNFVIYIGTTTTSVDNSYPSTISLAYCQGEHYDLVYPISHMNNLKSMQSLLYQILLESPSLSLPTDPSTWYNNAMIWWGEEVKIKQKKDMKIVETLNLNKRVYINPIDEYQLKQKKEKERKDKEKNKNRNNRKDNNKNSPKLSSSSDNNTTPTSASSSLNSSSNNNEMVYPAMEEMDEELRQLIRQIEQQDLEEQRQMAVAKHFPTLSTGKQNKNRNRNNNNNNQNNNISNNNKNNNNNNVTTDTIPATVDDEKTVEPVVVAWGKSQDWNQIKDLPATVAPVTTTTATTPDPQQSTPVQDTNVESTDSTNTPKEAINEPPLQFKIITKNRKK